MIRVIGVRFRTAGKIYFFDPVGFEIKRGDHVIVETARGIEFGTTVSGITEVEEDKVIQPLKPVIRIANERDKEQEAANKNKEKEAFQICLEKIRKHGLEMKLIDAEYTFDNNKVLFYFTADGRIDFRELVKDLASVFKTRIELRQIGVRDETKIVGGIGICGRPLCCHSYLSDFIPVSIKMAKEQNLSLNPTKISGVCGRLMCCLKNEEETYEELNRRLPSIGDFVTTDDGLKGEVQSVNVLRQLVKVVVEDGDEKEIKEYSVERLQFKHKHGRKEKMDLSREELQELERLEKEEEQEAQDNGNEESHNVPEGGQRRYGRERQDNRYREGRGRDNGRNRQEGDNREGGRYRQENDNREGGKYRQENDSCEGGRNRQENDNREGGRYRQENDSRDNGRYRQENDSRDNGRYRQENDSRDNGRYHQENDSREGGRYRQENDSRGNGRYRQENDSREGGRYRQENNQRQAGRNARGYHEGQRQGSRGRYDNRSRGEDRQRGDRQAGQEGQPGRNDSQAE